MVKFFFSFCLMDFFNNSVLSDHEFMIYYLSTCQFIIYFNSPTWVHSQYKWLVEWLIPVQIKSTRI